MSVSAFFNGFFSQLILVSTYIEMASEPVQMKNDANSAIKKLVKISLVVHLSKKSSTVETTAMIRQIRILLKKFLVTH